MKIRFALFSLVAMLFAVACEGPEGPETPSLVSINPSSIEFSAEGGEQTVTLTAKEDWTAKASAKWIIITSLMGDAGDAIEFEVIAEANKGLEARSGKVTFTVGGQKAELAVTQEAVSEDGGQVGDILEFFINPEGGYSGYSNKPVNLMSTGYGPGHQITLFAVSTSGTNQATLALIDRDYEKAGCDSYTHLTTHNYPAVEGDKNNAPQTSGYVVDPEMSYFIINGVTYYPIIPDSPTDEEGKLYGFNVLWTQMPYSDINVCEMRIPVEDAKGNQKTVVGGLSGKLSYEFEPEPSSFSLNEFGFSDFEYTVDADNVVTLESNSFVNGNFTFKLTTTDGSFVSAEGTSYSVEDKTLSGWFLDAETGAKFSFSKGSAAIVERDATTNAYTLSVKKAIVFAAPGLNSYKLTGDHNITISPKKTDE